MPSIVVGCLAASTMLLIFMWKLNEAGRPTLITNVAKQTIELGEPCDASQIAYEGNGYKGLITDSHGLQCEVYNESTSTSFSTSGIWGYPNAIVSPAYLLSLPTYFDTITQTWQPYHSPDGSFTFLHPSDWRIQSNPNSSSSILVLEGPYTDYGLEITYYPESFMNTSIYGAINAIPDESMSYKSSLPGDIRDLDIWPQNPSVGAFYLVSNFTSTDGLPFVTLESTDMVSPPGGETHNVNAYMIGKRSYLQFTYDLGDSDENILTGLSIESARLED